MRRICSGFLGGCYECPMTCQGFPAKCQGFPRRSQGCSNDMRSAEASKAWHGLGMGLAGLSRGRAWLNIA
eukprot:4508495-Pyramimonas_sp.AAC.1